MKNILKEVIGEEYYGQWIVSFLKDNERKVLDGYFFDNKTYGEIANYFGLTRERIRQIKNKVVRKIRYNLRRELNRVFKKEAL